MLSRLLKSAAALIVVATIISLCGCAAGEWLGVIDRTEQNVEYTRAELETLRGQLERLEDGSPEKVRLINYLAKFERLLQEAEATLPQAREAVLRGEDGVDAGISVGQVIATTIGGPWGLLAASVLGIGGHIYRSKQLADRARVDGAVNVASAIEKAKVNGVVDFNDKDIKKELTKELGPAGNKAVDIAQGKA